MAYDVFISYSSKDKTIADAVCAKLEGDKIRCWIAPRDVPPGQPYAASLVNAISASRVLVLVLSEGSNSSDHVLRELNEAVDHGIPIIPFRIQDVQPSTEMRFYIKSIHWLDAMTPPLEKHLKTLSESVQALLSVGDLPPASTGKPQLELAAIKRKRFPIWAIVAAVLLSGIIFLCGAGLWAMTRSSLLSQLIDADETAPIADTIIATSTTIHPTAPAPTDENSSAPLPNKYTWFRQAENPNLARWSHSGAYDVHRSIFVIFGGAVGDNTTVSDTLEWDGEKLARVETSQSPPPRLKHRIVYDSDRRVIVLFGGAKRDHPLGDYHNDTWEFDGADWKKIETPHSPSPRYGFGLAYDTCRKRVVLFGGYSNSSYESDTWEYDGSDWIEIKTANPPPPARSETQLAFKSNQCVAVLFGGETRDLVMLDDTWEYDGKHWVQRIVSHTPLPRWNHAMTFNPIEGKVILYGGYGHEYPNGDLLEDTWEYDGQTWAKLDSDPSPGPLEHFSLGFDTLRGQIVLFGWYGDIWYLGKVEQR